MARFVAVPNLPAGRSDLVGILGALKENVELITATRGESDLASRGLVRSDVTAARLGAQDLSAVTNVTDATATIAVLTLKSDVQTLANDLARTRLALNTLIFNLGG